MIPISCTVLPLAALEICLFDNAVGDELGDLRSKSAFGVSNDRVFDLDESLVSHIALRRFKHTPTYSGRQRGVGEWRGARGEELIAIAG